MNGVGRIVLLVLLVAGSIYLISARESFTWYKNYRSMMTTANEPARRTRKRQRRRKRNAAIQLQAQVQTQTQAQAHVAARIDENEKNTNQPGIRQLHDRRMSRLRKLRRLYQLKKRKFILGRRRLNRGITAQELAAYQKMDERLKTQEQHLARQTAPTVTPTRTINHNNHQASVGVGEEFTTLVSANGKWKVSLNAEGELEGQALRRGGEWIVTRPLLLFDGPLPRLQTAKKTMVLDQNAVLYVLIAGWRPSFGGSPVVWEWGAAAANDNEQDLEHRLELTNSGSLGITHRSRSRGTKWTSPSTQLVVTR